MTTRDLVVVQQIANTLEDYAGTLDEILEGSVYADELNELADKIRKLTKKA